MIYYQNLFEEALIKPLKRGNSKLLAVSGYASASLVSRHFFEHKSNKIKSSFDLDLVVGMAHCGGLSKTEHELFLKYSNPVTSGLVGNFSCSYFKKRPCVHSKVFVWLIDGKPSQAFVGSANYTQNGFTKQNEILALADPSECYDYFNLIKRDSLSCEKLSLSDKILKPSNRTIAQTIIGNLDAPLIGTKKRISFLANKGVLPARSGLNWGQRPDQKREPNQCYFKIPKEIADSGFFPTGGEHFILKMDDQVNLVCRLQQDSNKALTTPHDNSEIGRYIRKRIGNKIGLNLIDRLVEKKHLDAYGRNDVEYKKVDSHTFEANFSV